jgi:hypothetical protein
VPARALVQVWRDAQGAAKVYAIETDPLCAADGPMIYYDDTGVQRLVIGMHPVVMGSPEQQKIAAQQRAVLGGLREAETRGCPGGAQHQPMAPD